MTDLMQDLILCYVFLSTFTFAFLRELIHGLIIWDSMSELETSGDWEDYQCEHYGQAITSNVRIKDYFWWLVLLSVLSPLVWFVALSFVLSFVAVIVGEKVWYVTRG